MATRNQFGCWARVELLVGCSYGGDVGAVWGAGENWLHLKAVGCVLCALLLNLLAAASACRWSLVPFPRPVPYFVFLVFHGYYGVAWRWKEVEAPCPDPRVARSAGGVLHGLRPRPRTVPRGGAGGGGSGGTAVFSNIPM